MKPNQSVFERSVQRQVEINLARSPTARFQALCDLLDAARAMAPTDPDACERRRRLQAQKQREREELRAYFRCLLSLQRKQESIADHDPTLSEDFESGFS